MAYNIKYEYDRSIRIIIQELLLLKTGDKVRFYEMISEIKRDLGEDFYNIHMRDKLEDLNVN